MSWFRRSFENSHLIARYESRSPEVYDRNILQLKVEAQLLKRQMEHWLLKLKEENFLNGAKTDQP